MNVLDVERLQAVSAADSALGVHQATAGVVIVASVLAPIQPNGTVEKQAQLGNNLCHAQRHCHLSYYNIQLNGLRFFSFHCRSDLLKQTATVPMTMKQMMMQMPMRHTSRMSLSDDDVTEWWFVVCSCVSSTTENKHLHVAPPASGLT